MKTVLCFGDSMTWGSRPDGGGRHAFEVRWPNVLREGLNGVEVVADGLRGRTTAMDQHASPGNMNGAALLPSLLHSNAPVDVVILFLGTNDVYWGYPLNRAVRGIEHLIEQVRVHPMRTLPEVSPQIIVVLPPRLVPCSETGVDDALISKSNAFAARVAELCDRLEIMTFDAETVAQTSPVDGIHLDAENTRAIGAALVPMVKDLLT